MSGFSGNSPEKCACFFHSYLRCAHAHLQPVTYGQQQQQQKQQQNDVMRLRVDAEMFENAKKSLRFQYPNTCGGSWRLFVLPVQVICSMPARGKY